jgi:hypothetical protein
LPRPGCDRALVWHGLGYKPTLHTFDLSVKCVEMVEQRVALL